MKTPTSVKLSRFSAIRTKVIFPGVVLGICAMLNACSSQEEPTPVQDSGSNAASARTSATGLHITSNGNDITITVGFGPVETSATSLYRLVLGRNPENDAVIASTNNAINANGFAETKAALAFSQESRQNIIKLYIQALKRTRGEISEAEIAAWQAHVAENSLFSAVQGFASSQEAIDEGLTITVQPVFLL